MEKKEAMKILKDFYDKSALFSIRTALDTVIPELKESEGERIRKEMITYLSTAEDKELIPYETWIAWLEKQGEKVKLIEGFDTEFERQVSYLIASAMNKDYEYTKDFVKWTANGLLEYAKHELEKQGEQKETLCDKCKKAQPSHSCQDITELGRCAVEHEQKPIDKVEPKFEIGDLITNGILVGKIDEIHELGYHAYFGDHYADVPDIENWHKWTLKDAKDGDVLYSPTNRLIWIYKDNEHYHASINLNYADVVSFDNKIVVPSDVCPANRVQKSILFQKMEESGYKWDNEKKELKKIKQKTAKWHREDEQNLNACLGYIPDEFLRRWLTDIIHIKYDKPAELPKGEDYGIDGLYAAIDILQKTLGEVDGYQSDDGILAHKCAISAVKELSKQELSEEDEAVLDALIRRLEGEEVCISPHLAVECLKSLKERYTWKPSDEQMNALKHAFNDCSIAFADMKILATLYEQLKALHRYE